LWTPAVILLDPEGRERYRIEGYLPKDEFFAKLIAGQARIAFMQKKWTEAERLYNDILQRFPKTSAGAEAIYWAGVSHYKATNDHTGFSKVVSDLNASHPDSQWTKAAQAWAG
jgi:outer membrane protein assembly factor BamD (BamD/ComL family)